jgi:hypothetical protein
LIPSSRQVLIGIQLDAEATLCDWPGIWSSRITRMPGGFMHLMTAGIARTQILHSR